MLTKKLRRVRVQTSGLGMLAGLVGIAAMVSGVVDPAEASWRWTLGIWGNAIWALANLMAAWMENREKRDVNRYQDEILDLIERVERLEDGPR